jgi:hypothetical protein
MARTLEQIRAAILAEKTNHSELDGLTSFSTTAVWRSVLEWVAFASWLLESLWDDYQVQVIAQVKDQKAGTRSWYAATAKEYQHGDTVEVLSDGQVGYSVVNKDNQIIKYATVSSGRPAVVKVAKANGSGDPEALTTDELNGFKSYLQKYMFADADIIAQSNSADSVRLSADVYYQATVSSATVEAAVMTAIKGYLQTGIAFDGELLTNKVIDAVQLVTGVNDITISSIQAKNSTGSYADVVRVYQTAAGYIALDEANTTINLIAQ